MLIDSIVAPLGKMRSALGAFVLVALWTCLPAQAQQGVESVIGVWIGEKQSEITIELCEEGLCGRLSKIVIPPEIYAEHKDEIDALSVEEFNDEMNKDPLLRSRPMLDLRILTLTTQIAPNEFEGEVYNPEDGHTYYGKLAALDEQTLRLTGCGFFNLICQSEDWTRAPEEPEMTEN